MNYSFYIIIMDVVLITIKINKLMGKSDIPERELLQNYIHGFALALFHRI